MNNRLFFEKAYINGELVTNESTFSVINPSTGQVIGEMPDLSVTDTKEAIQGAYDAWLSWKSETIGKRTEVVRRLFELIRAHREELAEIITTESGKPLNEARVEVDYGNDFVEWFAEEGKRSYGDTIPSVQGTARLSTIKQSVGVVAAITPWNFPLAMLTRKVAPALVAGCSVVLKPASQTPFTAVAVAKLAEEAGVPQGVFQVLTSRQSRAVGQELATNPLVRKISFTGSTVVGQILMEHAASTIKRVSFELGGNAPFLIFDDADIDRAVQGAVAAKFRNAGQTCVAVNRFYVQDAVYDTFAERLTAAISELKVGDGFEENVQVGPLINSEALSKVQEHVQDALKKGAVLTTGGQVLRGNFYEPTVLRDVAPDSLIAQEETFGPVCALFRFDTEREGVALANDTPFGLAAYFYTENIRRCHRVAEALEAGMVGINTGAISNASAPFGGIKHSGMGREGGRQGLEEYLETKYLCYGV